MGCGCREAAEKISLFYSGCVAFIINATIVIKLFSRIAH